MDSGAQHRKTVETGGTADGAEPLSGGNSIRNTDLHMHINSLVKLIRQMTEELWKEKNKDKE